MSPFIRKPAAVAKGVPRASGDEPRTCGLLLPRGRCSRVRGVFPARAGMSPRALVQLRASLGVPRASGDEPGSVVLNRNNAACSPRERG